MRIVRILLQLVLLVVILGWYEPTLRWIDEIGIPSYMTHPLLNLVIFLIGSNLILVIISFFYRRRKKMTSHQTDNVLFGLQNIFYLITTSVLIITILALFGIDVVTLFTSLSIVAAAIAIVTKDYLNEIISGIIISFSKDIAIDDYIKINEQKGSIIALNLTKVILMSDDDEVISIPNHKFFLGEIVNYTKKQLNRVSIEFEVDIKLLDSVEDLEKKLVAVLKNYSDYIEKDSHNIKVASLKKDLVLLKFQYSASGNDKETERHIRKKVLRYIIKYIKRLEATNPGQNTNNKA
jgi:small-conductance mechanosensitive channel